MGDLPLPLCDCDSPDTYYGPHRDWCSRVGGKGYPHEPHEALLVRQRDLSHVPRATVRFDSETGRIHAEVPINAVDAIASDIEEDLVQEFPTERAQLKKLIDQLNEGSFMASAKTSPLLFPIGSLVRLKSGGPPMTVQASPLKSEADAEYEMQGVSAVHVIWFDNHGQLQSTTIRPELLLPTKLPRD